jgi:hypothetical protein
MSLPIRSGGGVSMGERKKKGGPRSCAIDQTALRAPAADCANGARWTEAGTACARFQYTRKVSSNATATA